MRNGTWPSEETSGGSRPRRHPGAAACPNVPVTEQVDPRSRGLDASGDGDILARLYEGQREALGAVEAALGDIARAVDLASAALARGGRLVYLAAGSPALIALADSLEIPQTFGESPDRFLTLPAGGLDLVRDFCGTPEDDEDAARRDVAEARVGASDCVVAISASGSTPFVRAGLEAAVAAGAATVAVANSPSAPILELADVAIFLDTGPEVVAGSTRMGAGTAQKAVLNMLSTTIAVRRGHVHDGHMVSLRADNSKLKQRALRMIQDTVGASPAQAENALRLAGGAVKPAILIAAGAPGLPDAMRRLDASRGNIRLALAALKP